MTVRPMSSEQARTEWRALLDLASQGGVDVVIERHGKATAAVISYETFRTIKTALAEIRSGAPAQLQGQHMASVLEQLAQLPDRTAVADPVLW